MSDRLALLKAILANPDGDLIRLVYADWLEESGTTDADAARAEFIRLGCKGMTKTKITTAETKWVDANWPRLLPNTLAARPDGANPPGVSRNGRFLRLYFRWTDAGRARIAELVFEFVRGFARRVEHTNGHGYQRFWQAAATDEPLAYHRPEMQPGVRFDAQDGPFARLLRTTWGDEVYERAVGFTEDIRGKEKVYRGVIRELEPALGFYPPAVVDVWGVGIPSSRVCAAVATAMTARAREFVGLV